MLFQTIICVMLVRSCAQVVSVAASPKACSAYTQCKALAGDCCPNGAGASLDCCRGGLIIAPAPTPAPKQATCQIGDSVLCGDGHHCAGDQCCKDGRQCPSSSPDFAGCKLAKLEDCTDGAPSPSTTPAPARLTPTPTSSSPGPSTRPPSPTPPVTGHGKSPALVWQSVSGKHGKSPKVQDGLDVVKKIAAEHVIDDFMTKYPDFKAVLWAGPQNQVDTVELAVAHAKKLCLNKDLGAFMKEKGYVRTGETSKHSIWTKHQTGEELLAKLTHPSSPSDPNNGFMRIFFNDVFLKLRQFNSRYGWDTGYSCLYDGDKQIHLIYDRLSKEVPLASRASKWVLPQMHYVGILPLDLHSGNFGMVPGEHDGVPVDLDATSRGSMSAFSKLDPADELIAKMELEYIQIDGILAKKNKGAQLMATEETQTGLYSLSVTWSAALGGLFGSSVVIAASQFKKKPHSEASGYLLLA